MFQPSWQLYHTLRGLQCQEAHLQPGTYYSLSPPPQCDPRNQSDCAVYRFSSGVNAIQEWYKLHYMNIMAQIDEEEKVRMSYSAEELILSCFFDGVSCDARSVYWGEKEGLVTNLARLHCELRGSLLSGLKDPDQRIHTIKTGAWNWRQDWVAVPLFPASRV